MHVNSHKFPLWAVQKPLTGQETMSCSYHSEFLPFYFMAYVLLYLYTH